MAPSIYLGSRSRRSRRRMRFRAEQTMMYRLARIMASIAGPNLGMMSGHPQEHLLEAGAGRRQIGARRERLDRAIRDLATAVHDDDAGAHLLHQMEQVRGQQDRRAGI